MNEMGGTRVKSMDIVLVKFEDYRSNQSMGPIGASLPHEAAKIPQPIKLQSFKAE